MRATTEVFHDLSPQQSQFETGHRPSAIAEQVRRRLQNSPYPQHRRLRISFREGVLTICGSVSSYYLRQTAQALVVGLSGVTEVIDLIEVVVAHQAKA